jgi:Uma2 family endonuclease
MTIGSKHAGTVKRLNKSMSDLLGDTAIVSIQDPIHIDDYNEPEPDVALLKPRQDFYVQSHPMPEDVLLVVEVSDSTVEYDRLIKKAIYAEAGIQEFWLVNFQDNTVECYSQPKNGSYRLAKILERGETIKSNSIENLVLQVDEILGA